MGVVIGVRPVCEENGEYESIGKGEKDRFICKGNKSKSVVFGVLLMLMSLFLHNTCFWKSEKKLLFIIAFV